MKTYLEEVKRVSRDFPPNYGHLHPQLITYSFNEKVLYNKVDHCVYFYR